MSISITLDQAYTGCKVPVKIERWIHRNQIKELEKETYYIDIPPGIDSNEGMILMNKGHMGPDGAMGDVRVLIEIEPHVLVRKGLDLCYTHTITLKEALCGFSFEIKHLNNKMCSFNNSINPAIIKPNYKKIIPSLGMTRENRTGNLVIEFDVLFPEQLTEEQKNTISNIL
jgi:DnaJ family protein B protein 4